jgi:putative DNA primase/helicase
MQTENLEKDVSEKETAYDYRDAEGKVIYQVVRLPGKKFFIQHFSETGECIKGLGDKDPVLYRLPEFIQGIESNKPVFICEGEKDADNLASFGLISTTCPMGAGKWRDSYTASLKGYNSAIVIADKDEPGRAHAQGVATNLHKAGMNVKIIELPDKNGCAVKDFTDWQEAGGSIDELTEIINSVGEWEPAPKLSSEYEMLVDEYGETYYPKQNGGIASINQRFWAACHARENIELYEPNEKKFFRYDENTGLYSPLSEDLIKHEIAGNLLNISRQQGIPSLEEKITDTILKHIASLMKGMTEKQDAFRKSDEKKFVHLDNGVMTFEAGNTAFVPFSPDFYSRNKSPIPYDPDAKCVRFLNELLYPAVTPEDAVLLQKYTGMALLGKNIIQRLLLLEGKPARGKTTLSLIVQKLIGVKNVSELRTRHLDERFETYRYISKTLLVGVDVPGEFLMEKSAYKIKGLVGGDTFDAEQKNGTGSFLVTGDFCTIITANSRLRVRLDHDSGAWRRRLLIVKFESEHEPKKIPGFADILIKEEGSGILNWALEGLVMLLDDVEKYGDIYRNDKQEEVIDRLLAESDSLRFFLEDMVVADLSGSLSVQEIIEAYAIYCPEKGWHSKPITSIERELSGLMLKLFKTTRVNGIRRDGKNVRGYNRVSFKKES